MWLFFLIQSSEFTKSLNFEVIWKNWKKKFHIKIDFYGYKNVIQIKNMIDSDRFEPDISNENIRILNFPFGWKL